jgi:hypothetical protein
MTRRGFFMLAAGMSAAARSLAVQRAQLDLLSRGFGVITSGPVPRFVGVRPGSADHRVIAEAVRIFRAELLRRNALLSTGTGPA